MNMRIRADAAAPGLPRGHGFPSNRLLAVLTAFLFVNYLDRYALSILLEPIKRDLGLSDTQIGLLTGAAFALLYSTLALPVARIAEHRDRTRLLSVAILTWSAATALCGLAGGFATLLAARMLVGAGESGAVAPSHSMVGDAFPLERRGTALAIFSTGGALGTALAPVVGGVLETAFGWRGAFVALSLLGLPIALLLLLVVRDPPRGMCDPRMAEGLPPPPFRVALRRLLTRPAFALLVPGMIFIGLAEYSLFLWMPSYFTREFGASAASVGARLTLFQGLPLLAGTLLGGVIVDRLIRRDRRWLAWLPAVACLVAVPTIALIFMVRSQSLAFLLLIVPSFAIGVYLAPSYAMIQALAGARSRATATATLTLTVNLLGLGLGPLLLGTVSDLLRASHGAESLRYAFFVIPPLYLLAAGMFLLASRHLVAGLDSAAAESDETGGVDT